MYGDQKFNGEIYSKIVQYEDNQPVLSSLVERCLKEVDWGEKQKIQQSWSIRCADAIQQIAEVNPFLPDLVEGEEILNFLANSKINCLRKLDLGGNPSWYTTEQAVSNLCLILQNQKAL